MESSYHDVRIHEPHMQSELLDTSNLSKDFDDYLNSNSDYQHIIEASPSNIPLTPISMSSKQALQHRRDYVYGGKSPFQLDEKNGCWKHRHKENGTLRSIVLRDDILRVLLHGYATLEHKGLHSIWRWVDSQYFGILRRDVEKFLSLMKKQPSTITGLWSTTTDPLMTNLVVEEPPIENNAGHIEVLKASPLLNSYSSPLSSPGTLTPDQSQSLEGPNSTFPESSPDDFSASNPSLRTTKSPETSRSASIIEAIHDDELPNPLHSETNPENLATTDSAEPQVSSLAERSHEFLKLKHALLGSKKAVIIAGAGISVQAGIPDFRSYKGLFAGSGKLVFDWPVILSLTEMSLHSHHEIQDLAAACKNAVPTAFHILMDTLAARGNLMRLYTQNIDCIDTAMSNLRTERPLVWRSSKKSQPLTVQVHGSVLHFECEKCGHISEYRSTLFEDSDRPCPQCQMCVQYRTSVRGQRATDVGTLYPRVAFYNDQRPLDNEAISQFVISDCKRKLDTVLVVGTNVTFPAVRHLIRDLSAQRRGGKRPLLIWLNKELPPPSLQVVWDSIVCEDIQDVAQDILSSI